MARAEEGATQQRVEQRTSFRCSLGGDSASWILSIPLAYSPTWSIAAQRMLVHGTRQTRSSSMQTLKNGSPPSMAVNCHHRLQWPTKGARIHIPSTSP